MGGMPGFWIGGTLGGAILQIPTQGGGISNALSQIGSFFPSIHTHSHAAKLVELNKKSESNSIKIF
jgi:hypothetical protein